MLLRSLYRTIILLSIVLFSRYSFSQTDVFDNTVPSSIVTCGDADTVSVVVYSVGGISNIRLEANLTTNFEFVSLIPNSNVSIVDTSNKNLPEFRFTNIPAGGLDTINFLIKSNCSSVSGALQFSLFDVSNVQLGTTVTSAQINADQPNLIITGFVNTNTGNQVGINLSQLVLRQKYIRTFKVDYTSLVGDIDSIEIIVEKPYHDVFWVSGGTSSLSVTGDSIRYKFDISDFGGTPLSPSNNVFYFSDSVELVTCPSTSLSIDSDVELNWGCDGNICQSSVISTLGSIIVSNPVISYVTTSSSLTNYCQTSKSYSFTVRNTQNATATLADYAYDLVIQLPMVRNNSTMYNPASFPNTKIYDSVKINGQIVPFKAGAFGLYPLVDSLTTAQYNSGGLTDENGDGLMNDLKSDSSIKVEVFYRNIGPSFTCNTGPSGRKIIYFYAHKAIYVDFNNMCGESMNQFRRQNYYQYLDFNSRSLSSSTSAVNGIPFSITFNEWAQFARFDWTKVRLEKRFIVPKGVSVASPVNIIWNGVTNNATVNYSITTKPGAAFDTISVFTDRMRGANNSDDNFTLDFVNDCSLNTDTCSELIINASSFVHIDSGNIADPCYVSPIGCGTLTIIKDCDSKHKGYNILSQKMQRATFGWTDNTKTTQVNGNTPGVVLDKVHPFDSIKLTAKIVIKDTAFDNLLFDINYTHLASTVDPIAFLTNSNKATITDVSSGSTFTFNDFTITKTTQSTTEKTLRLDLSNLRDSMRVATLNPLYRFGGDLGNPIFTSDTIELVFYMYGNQYRDYNINAQLLAFDNSATKSLIPTCIYRGVEIDIDHEAERISRRTDNYGWRSCSQAFYFDIGFSYLDAGSTSNPANPIDPKFDPAEYKPYTEFDSVYITWDEAVYFLDTTETYYSTRYYYGGINVASTTNTQVMPKKFVRIISSNELVVYTDSLAKRYALGARDHLQAALPFRNACGRDIESNSATHPNGNQRFTYRLYRNLYPQAIGGPKAANSFSSYTSVSATGATLPELQLTLNTPSIIANADTVNWSIDVRNTNLTQMTPYTWIDIQSPSGGINPVKITYGSNTYPLIPYANGFWAKIDTILPNSSKNLLIFADYTSCSDDSLIINVGYSCSQYPIDPAQGYPNVGAVCNNVVKSGKLTLIAKTPLIQNLIVNQPDTAVELCDTIDYTLFSQNSGEVDVKNFKQQLILPVSTLTIVPSTSEIEWPANSGTWVPVLDPTLSVGTYEWDFSSNFNGGLLPNANTPLDSNKFKLRFKLESGCPFTSGDQVVFRALATELCGDPVFSVATASDPIIIQGLPAAPATVLTIEFEEDTVNICTNETSGSLLLVNAVGGSTSGQERLIFEIDDTTITIQNPIFNVLNGGYLTSLVPHDTVINNKRVLEWALVSGVPAGDSIGFDFRLVSLDYTISDCSSVPIKISTAEKHQILCSSTSVLCDINFPITTTFDTLTIIKGEFTIENAIAIQQNCVDSVSLSFKIKNNGAKVPVNYTKISFASDTNNNGILDANDAYFTGQDYLITDSLKNGDSLIINHTLSLDVDACNIFIIIDSTNCACSINDTLVPISFESSTNALTICVLDSDSLPVCTDSKFNTQRTYTWTGLTGASLTSYLSSSSIIKPLFTAPVVSVPTTLSYLLETNRGNCSSFDTINILVNPLPKVFTTTDTLICPNTVYAISPDTLEAGITYSVWNQLTGGTNLGNSPFNLTITSDTSFYIEAQNTLTGCVLSPRIPINLFEDSIKPMVSCKDTTVFLNTSGTVIIDTSFILVSATDNCGIDSVYISNNTFNCNDTGSNSVTIYAIDEKGNIDSCSAIVTVLDTTNSTIFCKDTTIYLNATGSATIDTSFILVSATDICGIDSVYISNNSFSCIDTGTNSVTIYATDVNGNLDSCISTVTVLDTTNPMIVCKDTTIYLDATGSATIDTSFIIVSVSDICGIDSVYISKESFNCIDTGVNPITIYALDENGNLDSCISNVTIFDTINPIAVCKDTTIYLNPTGSAIIDTSFILVSASDICGIDSVYISNNTFNCLDTGNNQVTIYAVDVNGNLDSCSSTVTVLDTINPTVICKDTTIYLDATGSFTIDTSFVLAFVSDICGIDSVYISNNTFNCIDTGTNSVTIYALDVNGNLDSCISTVTVLDTINPLVVCKDTTIYLNATGSITIDTSFILVSVTDICGIDSVYISNNTFNCIDTGTNQVIIYLTDVNGNVDSCISTVTVLDTINPIVFCKDTTIYLDATGSATIDTSLILVSATDICGIDSVYISNNSFSCIDTGTNSVTIYARDVNGNLDSCISTVTVLDTINPVVVCNDTTIYLDATGSFTVDTSFILTSVSDVCGIDSVFISNNTFNCIDAGSNSVTIYAVDVNGNLDSCISTITVIDTINPMVVCKDTTIYLDVLGSASIDTSFILTSVSDICGIDSIYISNNTFNCIDTGNNSVTIYAVDVNGNIDSCVSIVTVIDTINPTVICNDTTIYLDATGSFTIDTSFILTSVSDICGIDSVYISNNIFSCIDTGSNQVTIYVQDVNGNLDSCISTVTVLDTINPLVICKDTTIYLDATGSATIDTSFVLVSASDICGIDTVYISDNLFNCIDTGANSVTIYITDVNGNLDSCISIVTVLDTINPMVVCKDTTIYLDAIGSATIDTSFILVSTTDVCGIDSVFISNNSFTCSDTGTNSVTIYVTDVNGNIDSCISTITILDTIKPIVTCKDTTIYLDATGSVTIDTSFILVSATDICGIDSVYISNNIFNCIDTGTNSVTIYVTDINGNLDSCIYTITVLDTIKPIVTCKDTTIYLSSTGSAAIDTSFVLVSANSTCAIDSVYISNNLFSCSDTGINSVTVYVTDVNGNIDSCISTVTVLDTINSIITCKDTSIYLDVTGNVTIDTSFILVSIADACGIDSVYISTNSFTCNEIGPNTVTIYTLDLSGNLDSCISIVTVIDTVNPIVICKDTLLYLNNSGTISLDTSMILISTNDACGIDSVYLSSNSLNCVDTGANLITVYSRDINGNIDSCISRVYLVDTINPLVVCKDTTIFLNTAGTATIDTSFILISATDICGIDSVYVYNNSFTCIDTGTNQVTIYVLDVNGNLDSCISTVTVLDTVNPTVVCKDTTIYLDATGSATIDTSFILISATDVCGIDSVYISNTTFNCIDTGNNQVTIYVTDVNGNLDSCISTVTVLDTIRPDVVCKDTTIYLNTAGTATIDTSFILVSGTDICGIDSVYISNNSFNCIDTGANQVTVYVTDVNGNLDSCLSIVTVIDTVKPIVICNDTTIYLDATGSATIDTSYILVTAVDICGIDSVYISNNSFTCGDTGTNSVTVYATDVNGNLDSCVANITVIDTIKPIVTCKDTTIYLDGTGSTTIDTSYILMSVTDVCGIDSVYISNNTFNCIDTGANSVTIYVTDINGNIDSCISTVTVLDTINPLLICKDTTIYLDALTGSANIDTSFILVSTTDICGIDSVYISNNSFSCIDTGTNSVTIYVTDVNGNLDSCTATVTVIDTINPVVVCKDTTIFLNATGSATIDTSFILVSVTDVCGIDSVYISNSTFNCIDTGTNQVTIYVTDVNGEIDSCIATVTVVDTINPLVICKDTTIYLDAIGGTTIDTSFILVSVTDICGIDSVYISNNSFSCIDTGTNQVTIYATDVNGNLDSCIATITVLDTINPILVCKDTTIYLNGAGLATIDTSFILVSATDICGIDSVYISNNTFNCIDTGNNQVTIYVTDVNGNLDSCIATITLIDTINPMAVCKDTTIYLDALGSATIDTSFILVSATDICGIDSVYISNNSFTCTDTGNNSVTIYAMDVNGNIDSCISNVRVLDTINPVVICKADTIYLNTTGNISIDTSNVVSSFFDNCTVDTLYLSTSNFTCIDTGNNSVTVYIVDGSGNLDSCQTNIRVLDTINPVVVCKNDVVYLDGTGNAIIDTSNVVASFSDNCSVDTIYLSNSNFSCGDTGLNFLTVFIEDINGNIDSCQAGIFVRDTLKPLVVCNNATVYLNSAGVSIIDTSFVLSSFTSNCTVDTVYVSDTLFTCLDTGANSVWVYVQDINGNLDSCMATVTVFDTIAPVIVCKDTTIYLDASGNVSIDSSFILQSFTDNCLVKYTTLSQSSFNCLDTGSNSVLITAYDPSGNLDSCRANVTVLDTVPPTAICMNTTVFLDSFGFAAIMVSDINNGSTDNCGIQSVTINKSTFNCVEIGANTITLTVTDVSGNISTCTGTVTVIDDISPRVTCPPLVIDTTLLNDCRFVVPDYSSILNTYDNCTDADSIEYTQSPTPGTVIDYSTEVNDVNTLSVSITATDKEMNSSTCNFDLMIGCRVNASIPQIFSPNGDGKNDLLYVYGRNFKSFQFIVYNRWGEKVFETNDPANGWDGTFRGKKANEGVYVYYFIADTEQFGEIIRKGDVTLVR